MKKIFALMLILAMVISLASCDLFGSGDNTNDDGSSNNSGSGNNNNDNNNNDKEEEKEETPWIDVFPESVENN